MINVSLTIEIAPDSAVFGGDLLDLIVPAKRFPLQRRFARDPFVRGVVRG